MSIYLIYIGYIYIYIYIYRLVLHGQKIDKHNLCRYEKILTTTFKDIISTYIFSYWYLGFESISNHKFSHTSSCILGILCSKSYWARLRTNTLQLVSDKPCSLTSNLACSVRFRTQYLQNTWGEITKFILCPTVRSNDCWVVSWSSSNYFLRNFN
jgi:hypothetical protein